MTISFSNTCYEFVLKKENDIFIRHLLILRFEYLAVLWNMYSIWLLILNCRTYLHFIWFHAKDHLWFHKWQVKSLQTKMQIHYAKWFSWIRPPRFECIFDYNLQYNIFAKIIKHYIFYMDMSFCTCILWKWLRHELSRGENYLQFCLIFHQFGLNHKVIWPLL